MFSLGLMLRVFLFGKMFFLVKLIDLSAMDFFKLMLLLLAETFYSLPDCKFMNKNRSILVITANN
jgi:hypothetical protein